MQNWNSSELFNKINVNENLVGDQISTNPIYKLTAPFQTYFHGRKTQKSKKPTNLNPKTA